MATDQNTTFTTTAATNTTAATPIHTAIIATGQGISRFAMAESVGRGDG